MFLISAENNLYSSAHITSLFIHSHLHIEDKTPEIVNLSLSSGPFERNRTSGRKERKRRKKVSGAAANSIEMPENGSMRSVRF